MKLTYQTIDDLNTTFNNLPVKGKTILTVAENIMRLESHIKTALSVKDKLIKEYADGEKQISNTHKNWEAFAADYEEILKQEVEVEGLQKINKTNINFDKETEYKLQSLVVVLMKNGLLE